MLAPGDDLVVLAAVDQGKVVAGELYAGDAPFIVEVPEGSEVFAWSLARDRVLGLDGRPLDSDALGLVEVTGAPRGCGRCLSPSKGLLVLQPGDDCEIPGFAVPLGRETSVPVSISWPGECACEPILEGDREDLDLQPIYPSGEAWPVERIALAGDGTLVGLGEHLAVRVDSDGQVLTRHAKSLLPGPILGLDALDNGEFIAAVHDPSTTLEIAVRLFVVHDDLGFSRGEELDFRPDDLIAHASGTILLGGWREGAAVVECPAARSCRELFGSNIDSLDDHEFYKIEVGPEDQLAAVGTGGGLLVTSGYSPGSQVEVERSDVKAAFGRLSDGSVFRYEKSHVPRFVGALSPATFVDGAVVTCATTGTVSAVLSTRLDPEHPEAPFEWRILEWVKGGCPSLVDTLGAATFASFSDGLALRCSATACEHTTTQVVAAGLRAAARLTRKGEWRAVMESANGFRKGPDDSEFLHVAGAPTRPPLGAALPLLGRTIFLPATPGAVVAVSPTGFEELSPPEPLAVLDAATDPAGGPSAVVTAAGELGFLDPDSLELSLPFTRTASFAHVAAVAPGRFLASTTGLELFVVADGELREVRVDWDDSLTSESERAPETFKTFNDVAGAAGGAIAVACKATAIRIDAYSNPPVGERIDLRRENPGLFSTQERDPCLFGPQLDCADVGTLSLNGRNEQDAEEGRVWRLEPSDGPRLVGGGAVRARADSSNANAFSSSQLESGHPVASAGRGSDLVIGFETSVHRVGASRRLRFGAHRVTCLAENDGLVFLGLGSGSIFVGQ